MYLYVVCVCVMYDSVGYGIHCTLSGRVAWQGTGNSPALHTYTLHNPCTVLVNTL